MDAEFKKLLAGDAWADTGDRVDPGSDEESPIIDRLVGMGEEYSSDLAPHRERINQVLRELAGGAKEVEKGVPEYDPTVVYKAGSVVSVSGNLFVAQRDQSSDAIVHPLEGGQRRLGRVCYAGRGSKDGSVRGR